MVEFTGFLNNKFRVKAVAGDNLVRGMIMSLMKTMMMMIIMLMKIMIIMLTNLMRINDDKMLKI